MNDSDRAHEWFACPECGAISYVIWDPGQIERVLPCSGCARDEHVEHLVMTDGTTHRLGPGKSVDDAPAHVRAKAKASLRRVGPDGVLAPVTVALPEPIGNRRVVKRGGGADEIEAWRKWGRVREGGSASEVAARDIAATASARLSETRS